MLPSSRNLFEGTLARRDRLPVWAGYVITLAAVAAAYGLTLLVPPVHHGTPLAFFFLAVTVSALVGRLRAGVLAIALSAVVLVVWILPPVGAVQLTAVRWIQIVTFLVTSWIIAWLVYMVDTARTIIYEDREWLRITLGSIADGVIATDAQGDVTWMNPVAVQLTGWSNADAVGRPLADVFHIVNEETRLPVANPVAQVLAERRVVGLANHTVLIARDGTERVIEDSAAPIVDVQHELRGVVLVFHDASERRARQKALQAAEERQRLALDAARMVAWEWDPGRGQIWSTDNYAAIYGMPPVRRAADGLTVVHPEDRTRHQSAADGATRGESFHIEFRIVRPDNGQVVWIEEWAKPFADAAGRVEKVIGVSMDVTARKQVEAANHALTGELHRRVHELQALFDLAPVGIAVSYDPSCREVTANATLARWLGMPKEANISRNRPTPPPFPYTLLLDGQEPPVSALPMERAVAAASAIDNLELEIIHPDGPHLTVVAAAAPLYADDGRVAGCISTYADITAQKAAEAALKQLNDTLEQRVAARTAELQQINRELDQFAYIASHDLKSPLRGIATLAGWIRDDAAAVLPPKSNEHLNRIQLRIQRMETLLNDLLAYSRAGRAQYPVEQVDVRAVVRDVVNLLNMPPGFTVTVEEPVPEFLSERVPLETVLRNLIGNAVKHHHQPAAGHVVVSARDVGNAVEFAVADDGPGIAPEFHERIFRVFQTLRPRDEVEGSGMGLAIVKRLVEGRGGTVDVTSAPGQGATFRFTWLKRD